MDAANISQLVSTVVSLDAAMPRYRAVWPVLGIALYFVGWTAFLGLLTLSRLLQPAFLYTDIPNTVLWFDPSYGIYICLAYMIPAGVIAVNILLDWLKISYWRQAYVFATLLRQGDADLTPLITPLWSSTLLSDVSATIKGVSQMGWQTPARRYRIWHMFFVAATISTFIANSIVGLTHSYATGNQPIDIITPLVAFLIAILFLIPLVRSLLRNWAAIRIDEIGLMLPTENLLQSASPIPWQDMRALYQINLESTYWLLFTDEHIYAWVISPTDFRQSGNRLAHVIVERTGLSAHDATSLCKLALSSGIPKVPATAEFAIFDQWQRALTQAKQNDTRQRLSFMPAIVLVAVGLVLGIATTFSIYQFAINWATRL